MFHFLSITQNSATTIKYSLLENYGRPCKVVLRLRCSLTNLFSVNCSYTCVNENGRKLASKHTRKKIEINCWNKPAALLWNSIYTTTTAAAQVIFVCYMFSFSFRGGGGSGVFFFNANRYSAGTGAVHTGVYTFSTFKKLCNEFQQFFCVLYIFLESRNVCQTLWGMRSVFRTIYLPNINEKIHKKLRNAVWLTD